MIILVLNCGSSSLKYQLLKMNEGAKNEILVKGIVERIGLTEGVLKYDAEGKDRYELTHPYPTHVEAINKLLEVLTSEQYGVISKLTDITAVGHRVAHGGEYFTGSALVDDKVKECIVTCTELAPLHNPANLAGITAMEKLLPNIPQVAVFDTSFHQTIPEKAFFYGIPYSYYEKYKIRRYGFHGTSHMFVAHRACELLNMDINNSKIVTCHMGNGSSVTAIHNGKSVDTSMGFTPLEGVMMGTRCGNLDPGVITFIQEKENMDYQAINNFMNKDCGLQGFSDVSSDMRDIWVAADGGNQRARQAIDIFTYGVIKYIGAYAAAMNGIDLVIFTGGIGENDFMVREIISKNLSYLGAEYNPELNLGVKAKDVVISTPNSKVKLMAVNTNEELVIATDTMNIVKNLKH